MAKHFRTIKGKVRIGVEGVGNFSNNVTMAKKREEEKYQNKVGVETLESETCKFNNKVIDCLLAGKSDEEIYNEMFSYVMFEVKDKNIAKRLNGNLEDRIRGIRVHFDELTEEIEKLENSKVSESQYNYIILKLKETWKYKILYAKFDTIVKHRVEKENNPSAETGEEPDQDDDAR